jgi:hypothetical protein
MNQIRGAGNRSDRPLTIRGADNGSDRRSSCRYRPLLKSAVLGWDEDNSRVKIPVELDNVSIQGCLVRSRVRPAPKPGERIWFKASEMNASGWIEGIIVSTFKPFLRKQVTRIRFVSVLPFQTFKVLVYGPGGIDPESIPRPEHETDQWWR